MNESPKKSPLKFRILIVDNTNSERFSNQLVIDALEHCESIVANGERRILLDDAKDKARNNYCHLGLIDMRLLDDNDPSDESGLELILELAPMLSVIVSGSDENGRPRADIERVIEALEDKKYSSNFIGYIKKTQERLHVKVISKLQEFWNWDLRYDLSKIRLSPKDIYVRLGFNNVEAIPEDEIDHIIRRSYNNGEKTLRLEALEGPYDSSNPTPSLHSSVVFSAEPVNANGGTQRREIIKIAPQDDVLREWNNYKEYIENRLQHQFTALITKVPVTSWEIGLIRYTAETDVQRERFTEWYSKHSIDSIEKAIEHLFREVFRPWYGEDTEARKKEDGNTFNYYTNPTIFKKLMSRIERYINNNPNEILSIESLQLNFINPVKWAKSMAAKSGFTSKWNTLIHGDLHSGNIIVGQDSKTYIIDYERVGPGYYLRDFVELEKDIRLRLLKFDSTRIELALFLDCLLMSQEFVNNTPNWTTPDYPISTVECQELKKAYVAICTIRKLAAEIGGLDRMDEYYWALLMETLLSVTDPRIKGIAYSRALLSASLICERLERWHNPKKTWTSLNKCKSRSDGSLLKNNIKVCEETLPSDLDIANSSVRPDFLLITALPEERDAVLSKLSGYKKSSPLNTDIATYYIANLSVNYPDHNLGHYKIVILPLSDKGELTAASMTINAIETWDPRYVLLIGIAGGVAGMKVKLGDILIADQIVDYELQRITPEGPIINYKVHQLDARLFNASRNFQIDEWIRRVTIKRPVRSQPTVHVGSIASGNKVIAFEAALNQHRNVWSKLVGVEMEAAGVATAVLQSSKSPGFFMIRCVSDLADDKKSSRWVKRWRPYACDAAASYAIAFLQSGPIPSSDRLSIQSSSQDK